MDTDNRSERMKSFRSSWDTFWFSESSGVPESYFRIAYAAILMLDLAGLFGRRAFFFSNEGIHQGGPLDAFYAPEIVTTLIVLWFGILVCLLVGFRTRIAAVANVLFVIFFFTMQSGYLVHAPDILYHAFGLYLVFMNSGARFSIDAKNGRSRRNPRVWPLRLAQIHHGAIFVSAGLSKLADPGWYSGKALSDTLRHPLLTYFDLSSVADVFAAPLIYLNYSVIVAELFVPILYIFLPRFRKLILISGIVFSGFIILLLRTGFLNELMMAGLLLFLGGAVRQTVVEMQGERAKRLRHALLTFFVAFHSIFIIFTHIVVPAESIRSPISPARTFLHLPIIHAYAAGVARIRPFNVWSSAFLSPVRFIANTAEGEDGIVISLPPFDESGAFAPGIHNAKEVREGIFLGEAALVGLTRAQWTSYAMHLAHEYRRLRDQACPRVVKLSLINVPLEDIPRPAKELRVEKALIAEGVVYCGNGEPAIYMIFSDTGNALIRD